MWLRLKRVHATGCANETRKVPCIGSLVSTYVHYRVAQFHEVTEEGNLRILVAESGQQRDCQSRGQSVQDRTRSRHSPIIAVRWRGRRADAGFRSPCPRPMFTLRFEAPDLSLIHISEPTRRTPIS